MSKHTVLALRREFLRWGEDKLIVLVGRQNLRLSGTVATLSDRLREIMDGRVQCFLDATLAIFRCGDAREACSAREINE
jgi:hypothetical protein